jgi:hypothetical protein
MNLLWGPSLAREGAYIDLAISRARSPPLFSLIFLAFVVIMLIVVRCGGGGGGGGGGSGGGGVSIMYRVGRCFRRSEPQVWCGARGQVAQQCRGHQTVRCCFVSFSNRRIVGMPPWI